MTTTAQPAPGTATAVPRRVAARPRTTLGPPPAGWRGPAVFVVLSFVLAWIATLPLYTSGAGLDSASFGSVALLMMATPAVAAVLTVRFVDRERRVWARLGVTSPGRPWTAVVGWTGIALGVCLAVVVLALPVGALLGAHPADVVGLSGLRAAAAERSAGLADAPAWLLVAGQVATLLVATATSTVPALGEELGWRGYLFPRLLRLGPVPAIAVSGVVWGAWHTPLLLLGYNYPGAPPLVAVAAMCGMCTVTGALLGWVRLRSESVWPAAVGHGAINAAAGVAVVLVTPGVGVDTTRASILGWSGWVVPLVVVVVLLVAGQVRRRPRHAR